MNPEILITNCLLMSSGSERDPVGNQFVHITGNLIKTVGPMSEVPFSSSAERLDARGSLVMPGLINCHNHCAMSLFRGMADDLDLDVWLRDYIFPAESRLLDEETVYWCTKLAAAEMIASGTTTVADGYFYEDAAARALEESGMRAVAAQGVIDFPAPGVPDPADNLTVAGNFLEKWQGHERITPAVFAHSPYTCGAETLQRSKELAATHEAPFFIHLAETEREREILRQETGLSPAGYLDDLGILDSKTICIHCVAVNDEDIEILAARKAGVVTCPESNMKLASGTAPVPDLLKKGVAVGLGTDSPASNNNCDMFREMDMLAKLQKVSRLDPTVMSALEVLRIATTGGARVLGLSGSIDRLVPGSLADLIIVDMKRANLVPFLNTSSLVYCAGGADILTTIINGKVLMKDREILSLDCREVMDRVRSVAEKAGL